MRNIGEVVDKMLVQIPKDYSNLELIRELNSAIDLSRYKAPEQILDIWEEIRMALVKHIPQPYEFHWQEIVINIWMDKT